MSQQGLNLTACCACHNCLRAGQRIIHQRLQNLCSGCPRVHTFPEGPHWQPLRHRSSVAFRSWLYDLCRGIDDEPVKNRHLPQSIGCSKNFPGKTALATQKEVGKANVLQKEKTLKAD